MPTDRPGAAHRLLHWLDGLLPWLGLIQGQVVSRTEGRVVLIGFCCDSCDRVIGALELASTGPLASAVGEPRPDLEWSPADEWNTVRPTVDDPAVCALLAAAERNYGDTDAD